MKMILKLSILTLSILFLTGCYSTKVYYKTMGDIREVWGNDSTIHIRQIREPQSEYYDWYEVKY